MNMQQQLNRPRRSLRGPRRRGAILVLMAVMIPILVIMSSFTINMAYMQLTRTEMMVATDAAARAGGRALSEFQDVDLAKAAIYATAAENKVGGVPLRVKLEDDANQIEFGDAVRNANGNNNKFNFIKGDIDEIKAGNEVANAIRVTGNRGATSDSGAVGMLFPAVGIQDEYDLGFQTVAMQVDRDICLVLDRSGSMSWVSYDYPAGTNVWSQANMNAAVVEGILETYTYTRRGNTYNGYRYTTGNDIYDYYDFVWEDVLGLGTPPQSPWEELVIAVNSFLDVLEDTHQQELVSIASYSSWANLDLSLEDDYQQVRTTVGQLSPSGATAIGKGMEAGMPSLLDTSLARPFAAKTLIVMTDGMHNSGIDPVTVAGNIVGDYNVTIHTVTFSPGADQNRMQQVADIGGGTHYHANTGSELIDAFEEIANNLPTIVTQ